MKKTFVAQLNDITTAAQRAITEIITQQKSRILFSPGQQEGEWTVDIYQDVPDFPYYDKYGAVHFVAVKEVHQRDTGIKITGICKGDLFPQPMQVFLDELDAYSSASLADHLLSGSPPL